MSVSLAIANFQTGSYTVSRPSAVTYDERGEAQGNNDPTVLTVDACEQPVSGADLRSLPEGTREDEVRVLFALQELRNGDSVGIGAEAWEVTNVQDWSTLGGYWKALCTKP